MFSGPALRLRILLGALLGAAAFWSAARYASFGLFGCDAIICHVAGLRILDGQFGMGWIWQSMTTMGRFQAGPQLVGSALFCAAEAATDWNAKWWWWWIAGGAVVSIGLFAWGVGRRVKSATCGALVFLAVISGFVFNLAAQILATWPVFIWGLGAMGLGLAFEGIPALSAFFYFLAACLGNETMLAWLGGLAAARWWMEGRSGRALLAAPAAWGAAAFLGSYLLFSRNYPGGYIHTLPSFSQLPKALLSWRNLTVSQLPGYDFARLAVERPRGFGEFITKALRFPRVAFSLLGFAFFCGGAAAVFLRRAEAAEGGARSELACAFLGGAFLSCLPLALTPKYSEMFTSPLHGFYYTYSFFGYAALCAAFVLALNPWRGRAAAVILLTFIFCNALSAGLSSAFFLIDIRRVASRWTLFEQFVDDAGRIVPPGQTVHLVAPDLDAIVGAMEPPFLMDYWNTKRSLLAKAGRPGPASGSRVDFLPALPARRAAGEKYLFLTIDETGSRLFSSLSVMRCVEAAPDWDGAGPVRGVGPAFTWIDRR